ncbi:Protein BYPASS-related [Macleaya cordata]|uniref:Protein BYPASS-related n=1 Tax=Macleaya cordata TaxID=56857 RepID=A0A200QU08_MACCD|nr:Protein BYPASS-related [Macleaya cordata]
MSRPHDGHRPFFPFGNPFRMIFPKDTYLSQKNLELLNAFEETLAKRLRKLNLKDKSEVLSLSWMRLAIESLCETHTDIKSLITDLKFPVSDWEEKWMDVYLDSSVSLLDICIAFSSELARLNQGQLLLQCVRHVLDVSSSFPSLEKLVRSRNSLGDWMQQINSRNQKLENCSVILDRLTSSLYLAKVKNSAKGKVLMRAMYGVMVQTIFVCCVFAGAFSGSAKTLMDLQVSDKFLWAEAFNGLQLDVNTEVRYLFSHGSKAVLKELEAVDSCVKKLYPLTSGGADPAEAETLKNSVLDLGKSAENLSQGLDVLSKEVENFFQIVLSGRDALLCNLRVSDSNSKAQNKVEYL